MHGIASRGRIASRGYTELMLRNVGSRMLFLQQLKTLTESAALKVLVTALKHKD